jgi:hypothetical protein
MSKVTISNLALAKVGSPPISSMDEDIHEARCCNLIFEAHRDEVLQIRPWPSCTKRVKLQRIADSPAFGYQYAYRLPADYIDVQHLGTTASDKIPFEVEGNTLLTDAEEAPLKYTFRNTETARYEPGLVELIACRMAIVLAMTVAQNASMQVAKQQEFDKARMLLRVADGPATGHTEFEETTIVQARM